MFNHLSAADPMVVSGLGLKVPLVYTYKDSINKIPTMGPVMKFVGHHAIKFKYDKKNDRKVAVPESVRSIMQVSHSQNTRGHTESEMQGRC